MQFHGQLHLFQCLEAFSRAGHMQGAAEILGITQPTVSRQLEQLDDLLPEPPLEKVGRRYVLTDFGNSLVNAFTAHTEKLTHEINTLSHLSTQPKNLTLKIAAPGDIIRNINWDTNFPGSLHLLSLSGKDIVQSILSHQIEIAITQRQVDTYEYNRKALFEDETVIIVPKRFSQRAPKFDAWKKIALNFPRIEMERSRKYIQTFVRSLNLELDQIPRWIVPNWDMAEQFVDRGRGWAVVPSTYINRNKNYYVLSVPKASKSTVFFVYYKSSLARKTWMTELIADLKNHFRQP